MLFELTYNPLAIPLANLLIKSKKWSPVGRCDSKLQTNDLFGIYDETNRKERRKKNSFIKL